MTLAELTTAILAIAEDYAIYISAGAVFGLAIFAVRRLLKGMR